MAQCAGEDALHPTNFCSEDRITPICFGWMHSLLCSDPNGCQLVLPHPNACKPLNSFSLQARHLRKRTDDNLLKAACACDTGTLAHISHELKYEQTARSGVAT
jgi:hypothetical protein